MNRCRLCSTGFQPVPSHAVSRLADGLKFRRCIFLALLWIVTTSAVAEPRDAARDVLTRTIGDRAASFTFEQIPAADGQDVYEIEAHGGKVIVRGNTPVSMSRGAYAYLRQACHCMVGWEGRHIDLPATLPDFPQTRVVSPYQLRQDYNVCTFGYTTAFWDWPQWEHELDWMALHGINMPLASVATEAIWQRVWLDEGISQEELDHYFTGPAFYPWHRMGNVNGWDGPAPKSFFPKQIELQKKIIGAMRELGMQPVARRLRDLSRRRLRAFIRRRSFSTWLRGRILMCRIERICWIRRRLCIQKSVASSSRNGNGSSGRRSISWRIRLTSFRFPFRLITMAG